MTDDRMPAILVLWSAPRSRSTALFRMMAERGDFRLVHEPFSNLADFGSVTVDGRTLTSEHEVLVALRTAAAAGPLFVKDTTDERYPELLADRPFLARDAVHTFLIRHPRYTVPSYHRLNPSVRREQIGIEHLYEVFDAVRTTAGQTPVVLDAEELVDAPDRGVRAFCAAVGLTYRPSALRWRPEDRVEWQPTRRWHVEVSQSTGLHNRRREIDEFALAPVLREQIGYHTPFYEKLHACRLRF